MSIQSLNSKTGFLGKYNSHQDKTVKKYLEDWAKGKTVLAQDWSKQIENGKITNVQHNGFLVGRKQCAECQRYRCKHVQYSGGIRDQNNLVLSN